MERCISCFGLLAMIGLAWLLSSHKTRVNWRVVLAGVALQFLLAVPLFYTSVGKEALQLASHFFTQLLAHVEEGTLLVFGVAGQQIDSELPPRYTLVRTIAFGVLPTIIFFSSLMSILYHLGVMQWIVKAFAWAMQKILRTSGAESLAAAANIFVGQTEAPLVIRPYVKEMTRSELMSVMVGGFATIAGGVLALYVSFGMDAGHLLAASVISAPAALLIAKVMVPETGEPKTLGSVNFLVERKTSNVIDAAAVGATDGMKLAINVAAMLIAFIALLALLDAGVGWLGGCFGWKGEQQWTLAVILGTVFSPFAWLMGIERGDCFYAGELLGLKMAANELIAYQKLNAWMNPDSTVQLSERTVLILTYALCGFANFGSIGIQLGGIGGIAPERSTDLASLGLRAMLGGTLAAFMTACVAGILL